MRKDDFKAKNVEKKEVLDKIAKQCLLESETTSYCIWKGGENEWLMDGAMLVLKIEEGIKRFPAIGLDGEGNGAWFQLSWVGKDGIESLVLGLRFFPVIFLQPLYMNH